MQTRLHRVRARRELTGGCYVLDVEGPFPETLPGQFYMLQTADRWPVYLPRPFSLYDRGADGEWGTFLLKAIGPGTHALHELEAGDEVRITGPLGRSFPEEVQNPICVAGGIGLAPFLLLARRWRDLGRDPVTLLFGGRDKPSLAGIDDFDAIARVHASTDDGSFGYHGRITGLMTQMLDQGEIATDATVFCCGPDPMMEAVADLCRDRSLKCYVSLETYMACGYGVCNGCTVEVQGPRFDGWPYSKTCMDGPVYESSELVSFCRHEG